MTEAFGPPAYTLAFTEPAISPPESRTSFPPPAANFVVGDELFWGNGRLEDALAWASYQTDEDAR